MLTIRDAQMKVFEQAALQRFESEMLRHAQAFSPKLSGVLGDERLRDAVRRAIDRARGYGLTNRGPIRLFIELSFLFGSAFDTDPQYPWAHESLARPDPQMDRADVLHACTLDYQQRVSGPGAANTRRALNELAELAVREIALSPETFVEVMREEMARAFPQKVAYIGGQAMTALLEEARNAARQHRFPVRGEALFVALMFAFGHGCITDPLYPWISGTLADDRIVSAEARAKRLERKARTWLRHVVASFD
jgi:hypothetical protein